MSLRTSRLTLAEWVLGIGSLLLLADLFGASWFAYSSRFRALATMLGQRSSANGWQTFTVLGPMTLVVCLAGIAILWLTAARRSPALPVVITTLLLPVSFVQVVLIAIRVLLDGPSVHLVQAGGANVIEARPGAYIGLALSLLVFAGVYLSLRRDGVAAADSPSAIERLSAQDSPTESHA
jgi:Co/Zn/Cd efflux system component